MAGAAERNGPQPTFRHRLEARIIISFLIFGTLLSGLFAVTALGMRQYLENVLIDETLTTDLKQQLDSIMTGTAQSQGFSSRYWAYTAVPERALAGLRDDLADQPSLQARVVELISLPSGVHSIDTDTQSFKVAIDKRPGLWGFVFFDVTSDARESWLMALLLGGAFVALSLLALLLARWSARKVIAPVSDLARRIDDLGHDLHPEELAPNYADDEVGQLAGVLDEYRNRLLALTSRDREFNADVSHELRTPLAVIKSATELLMAQPELDDKTRTRLHRIERAARQSTELTEALLHLVRAERNEADTGEHYRIDKVVEEVIDFKRNQLGRKPVEVRLIVDDSFLVCAPEAVIAVALGNLIGNAFKYTPQGYVDITVGEGKVVVEDTGPGLEADDLQKVFTRHYRGSSVMGKGSGLGLAIVQRFCELYKWTVRIETRREGGLRATLDFTTN